MRYINVILNPVQTLSCVMQTTPMTPDFTDSRMEIHAPDRSRQTPRWLVFMEWLLIFGMMGILIAPFFGKIVKWPPVKDLKENRKLAPRPDFLKTSLDILPHDIDQWWNDRFAFRTQLIPLRELIWLDMLHAPGKQYIQGLGGHLFLNPMPGELFHGGQNPTVLDYLGFHHLTADQLSNWADYLEGKSAWLHAYGIHYLFVIAPNKITIEDRYLPEWIRSAKGKTYLEQLREQVFPKLTSQVDILDLTPILTSIEQETGRPMFSRAHDVAHWNGDGFSEGLRAMDRHLRRTFPDMPPFPEDKIQLQQTPEDPTVFSCLWKEDPTVQGIDDPIIPSRTGEWTDSKCSTADGRKGRLVLFSDSSWKCFCGGLIYFLPSTHTAFPYQWEHHRHADIYHVRFNELQQIVRKEQPNAIVEAQTERAMMIPPEIGVPSEFRLAARFVRGNTLYSLSENGLNSLSGFNIDEMSDDGDAIVVRAANEDPSLKIVNPLMIPDDFETVLLIDMDAPSAGILQIFWSEHAEFNETDSYKMPIETGRNILFLPVPVPTRIEQFLRIDPGTSAGMYRIRKVEIHATPAGSM